MKIHDVAQGTAEWYALRLGIPTASDFHKIVTPARCELSDQAKPYAYYLIAEALLHEQLDSLSHLEHVARGREQEAEAVGQYEIITDTQATLVGFVTTDDGRMGASPDRFIGERGLLEVKCPAPQTQVAYMAEGPGADYFPQVQGQMLICEREWVDFFAYHRGMPPVRKRIFRNEPYIAKLNAALRQFIEAKTILEARVRAMGHFEPRRRVDTPVDRLAQELGGYDRE